MLSDPFCKNFVLNENAHAEPVKGVTQMVCATTNQPRKLVEYVKSNTQIILHWNVEEKRFTLRWVCEFFQPI